MATARVNRNTSAKSFVSTPTSHAHVNKARNNKILRVRGRLSVEVGRAETRDKISPGPPQRHQAILTPYISGEKNCFDGLRYFIALVKLPREGSAREPKLVFKSLV